MSFEDSFFDHLSNFDAAPLLFVGSGMSRRYLGADDWEGLLRRFADLTGKSYERYKSDADGDSARVAADIAEQFRHVWWEDPAFEDSRREHPSPAHRESPLKIEVAKHFLRATDDLPTEGALFEELKLLRNAVIEGAITTNYDLLLEDIFSGFEVFVGQNELLFNNPQGVGEIYKIHGSARQPESIVLTADDYDSFNERNQYLAAKLLTMFVEHPIVFLGYSLSDPNIQAILRSIAVVLTVENLHKLQDRLIFIQWSPEPVESSLANTFISVEGVAIPILAATVNDFVPAFSALSRLRRRINPQLLRRVREQVYDLVSSSESKGSLFVRDIDDDVDPANVEIVIGVGIREQLALQGVVGWKRFNVLRHVLEQDIGANKAAMETVSRDVLPAYLSGGTNTPVFYYLAGAGRLNEDGKLANLAGLDDRVKSRASKGYKSLRPTPKPPAKMRAIIEAHESFESLAKAEDRTVALQALQYMPLTKVDETHLRQYLLDEYEETAPNKPTTVWAKAVCIYDALAFGPLKPSGRLTTSGNQVMPG
jgi:hypothetical protein